MSTQGSNRWSRILNRVEGKLEEIADAEGKVVTREDLMADVWDMNWFGSTKTLDVHIRALRKKLGDSATESTWIHTVRGVGFRFARPEMSGRKP
mgnify:CR=1 FL=1